MTAAVHFRHFLALGVKGFLDVGSITTVRKWSRGQKIPITPPPSAYPVQKHLVWHEACLGEHVPQEALGMSL